MTSTHNLREADADPERDIADSHTPDPGCTEHCSSADHGGAGGISLLALANTLLRQRLLVLTITAAVFGIAILATILSRSFSATSVFMPQTSQRGSGALLGLASQFGVSLSGSGGGESPVFYAELPSSRELLRELAATEFRFTTQAAPTDTIQGTPADLLKVRGTSRQDRLNKTIDVLSRHVAASPDLKVGTVTLKVTAPYRELAELMSRRILDLVNDFNMGRRRSQATAERQFVEGRMRAARNELDSAEAALEDFLEQNRRYQESPRLAFVHGRLQRRIDLQQQVYLSLAKAYEDARIEEVRNTPIITIIDPPEASSRRAGSGVLLTGLLAAVLGAMLGAGVAFVREGIARQQSADPSGYAEFLELRRATFGRLTRATKSRISDRPPFTS